MSYPDINTKEPQAYLDDLLKRKEFYNLRIDPERDFRRPPGVVDEFRGKFMQEQSYQLFIKNIINPNTPNNRLIIKHGTGIGKTLSSILPSIEFIKLYKQQYQAMLLQMPPGRKPYNELDISTPSVFVLGFGGTKAAFTRDLLKYPELGFITQGEKLELKSLQNIAATGIDADVRRAKEYLSTLKKKITSKRHGGFFKFYGYQEFVNKLFISEDVNLIDLESQVISKSATSDVTLEDLIEKYIADGKIKINMPLLKQFEHSIIICDEFHNLYNSFMKNNYGIAIQYVLDYYPKMRAMFLSATPINNSPTEIIDILNFMLPKDQKVRKKTFFTNNRTMKPNMLDEISRLFFGKISFLQDTNIQYYPERIFNGTDVTLDKTIDGVSVLPYLKFICCKMSPLHQRTYNDLIATSKQKLAERAERTAIKTQEVDKTEETAETVFVDNETSHQIKTLHGDRSQVIREELMYQLIGEFQPKIPTDGYAIYDMVFPNPLSSDVGLFRSGETKSKIALSDQTFKDKNKIQVLKYSGTSNIFTGNFLNVANIGTYSAKYEKLMNDILAITTPKKIMIYHDRVRMTGVLLIQEMLKVNNFIDEFSEPVDNTLCSICGVNLGKHKTTKSSHDYNPARFVMAHSDIDKNTMEQSIAKFNHSDNATGIHYKILVGSKIIKESYEIRAVQELMILTLPVNIPTLIQVFGRCIRKNSHEDLPKDQRKVNISIYMHQINKEINNTGDNISPEEYRYVEKLNDYVLIQKIEREMNKAAIDAEIHRDIVMPEVLRKEYFKDNMNTPIETIGNLYFEPAYKLRTYNLSELNLATFTAYGYGIEEINNIIYVLKRLFLTQSIWTYDDLWAATKAPPISLEYNPKMFLEENFIIALSNLVYNDLSVRLYGHEREIIMTEEQKFIDKLLNPAERFIYKNGKKFKIDQVGDYYILFPIVDNNLIKDIGSYARDIGQKADFEINIENYVRDYKSVYNYEIKKQQFILKYSDVTDLTELFSEYSHEFYFKLLEDIIILSTEKDATVSKLFDNVLDLFDQLDMIIYIEDLCKYRETAQKINNKHMISVDAVTKKPTSELPKGTPVGYVGGKSIMIYDKPNWLEVNKGTMNRFKTFTENNILIGFFEQGEGDKMRFKVRKPIQVLQDEMKRSTKGDDSRLIERGIVCQTKGKKELEHIATSLNIKLGNETKIKSMCDMIQRRLLDLEMRERQKDSKIKYVYMSHEDPMRLTIS